MLKMPRDTKRLLSVPAALAMFGIAILTGSCGGGNADAEDPCHDSLCSGHGTCALVQDEPICACDPGYHPDGLSCLPDDVDPCQGIDCSDHGSCVVQGDEPTCVCETGYHPEDIQCVANSSEQPCEGVDCSGHGTCIVQDGYPDCQCDDESRQTHRHAPPPAPQPGSPRLPPAPSFLPFPFGSNPSRWSSSLAL